MIGVRFDPRSQRKTPAQGDSSQLRKLQLPELAELAQEPDQTDR